MIEFEHVSYSYAAEPAKKKASGPRQAEWGGAPDASWALRDVSFRLREGEFLGIAGHTGSGKSTLLQHMNGLLSPTQGQVLVDGADLASKQTAAQVRMRVGLVFQYPERQLFASSVFDDVAFGPRNLGLDEAKVRTRVEDALCQVDLDPAKVGAASPFELSGGQQRRVAFAGVLAMQPSTLVLDEPAAGLDPKGRREMLSLVARLHAQQGVTVAMVSHNMDDLASLCDRIMVLNAGRLVALGAPRAVFARPDLLKAVGLALPAPAALAARLSEAGIKLPECGPLPTLEALADAIAHSCQAAAGNVPEAGR